MTTGTAVYLSLADRVVLVTGGGSGASLPTRPAAITGQHLVDGGRL